MGEIIQIFEKVAQYYGNTAAIILVILLVIGYGIRYIINKFPTVIEKYWLQKIDQEAKVHTKAANYRKKIMPKIREELNNLAQEVDADRAVLVEFSNGSSNLIGLPFLYLSITSEVVSPGIMPIAHLYQKINTTVLATFLENLEDRSYFFIPDVEEIKTIYPVLYSFMVANGSKSALFYELYGVDTVLGFVVVSTINKIPLERTEDLPKVAEYAQRVSSLLNFDSLQESM